MWPNAPLGAWILGLRRRWWLIIGLPALTVVFAVVRPPAAAATVEARLTVAIDVQPDAGAAGRAEGTVAEVGEALVDDLSRILPGDAFAQAVSARLSDGDVVAPGEIQASVSSEDRHRVTYITIRRAAAPDATGDDPAAAERAMRAIAAAVVAELTEHGDRWSGRLGTDGAVFSVVDGPRVARVGQPLAVRLAVPLRLLLALLAAFGIATALYAIDPVLYTAADATAAAAAPVLGAVPRRRRRIRTFQNARGGR